MLPRDVLKSYLREMPRGHIFDLTYKLLADLFPPGEPDASSREQLRRLAGECGCDSSDDERVGFAIGPRHWRVILFMLDRQRRRLQRPDVGARHTRHVDRQCQLLCEVISQGG